MYSVVGDIYRPGVTQRRVRRFWPAAVHAREKETVVDSLVLVVYHVTTLSTVTNRVANRKILKTQKAVHVRPGTKGVGK